jgi:outer membrane protein
MTQAAHAVGRSLFVVIALSAVVAGPALAETSNATLLGLGVRDRPTYDGSNSYQVEAVPVLRYLGEPWFVRSTLGVLEGGLRAEVLPGLHAGAQVAYEPKRQPSESDFMREHQIPGIDPGASVGVHAEWDHQFGPVPVSVLGRWRQSTDSDRGAQADLRASVGVLQFGRLSADVYVQQTWANAKAANLFYGVPADRAAMQGLPAYQAGSGPLSAGIGLDWSFDLYGNWVAEGHFESRRLQGDAADSPIAERKTNHYVSVGIAYRY